MISLTTVEETKNNDVDLKTREISRPNYTLTNIKKRFFTDLNSIIIIRRVFLFNGKALKFYAYWKIFYARSQGRTASL